MARKYTIRIIECREGGWRIEWTEPGIRIPDGLSQRFASPADAMEVLVAIWREKPQD